MEFFRTGFSKKGAFALMLCTLMANSSWAASYCINDSETDGNWETAAGWMKNDGMGWAIQDTEYPDDGTDSALLTGISSINVNDTLTIGTVTSDGTITITVKSPAVFEIGSLKADGAGTITVEIESGATLKLNDANNGTGTINITGSGTLDLSDFPASSMDKINADPALLPLPAGTWTGAIDSDWSKPGNWSGITAITELKSLDTVTIPAGCTNYPTADNAVTLDHTLVIESGASVSFNDAANINKINSQGQITGSGTLTIDTESNLGVLNYTGDLVANANLTATSISVGGTSSLNGTVTTTGTAGQTYTGAVTLAGDTTFDSGTTGPVKFLSSVTGADKTLTLKGATTYSGDITVNKWHNEGNTVLYGTGTTPTVKVSTEVTGNNTFYNLTAGSGSASITFEAGKTQTVNGTFTVSGSAASKTTIKSSTAGTKWNLKVASDKAAITNAIIQDTQITDSVVIYLGSDKGCIYGGASTTSNDGLMISSAYRWKAGAVDSSVANPANWSVYNGSTYVNAVVPPYTADDIITVISATNSPDFDSTAASDFTCKSLTLETGANFKISGEKNIIVKDGTITNNGKITFSNTGRIKNNETTPSAIMDGAHGTVEYTTGAGQISNCNGTGQNDYYNLIVSATLPLEGGHQITIGNNFTLADSCNITTGGQSLHIAGASSIGGNITTGHSQTYGGAVTFTTDSSTLLATDTGNDTNGNPYRTYFGSTITGKSGGTALTFNDAAFSSSTTMTNISTLTVNETTNNAGTITTSGVQTYTGAVTNTGTINVPNTGNGTTAITFNTDYNGTGGSLIGNATSNPAIDFKGGDVTFGTFTHSGDKLLFSSGTTNIKSNVTAQDLEISTGATVTGGSATITVQNNWTGTGTFTPGTSTVVVDGNITGNNNFHNLTINGTGTSSISGQHTIDTFECSTPGKTLSFEAGKKQTISTKIQIEGTAANPITLQSATNGTAWEIDCSGVTAANKTISYASVKDSTADASKITASNSISLGNNTNWIIAGTYRWTGHTSSAWALAENWSVLQFNGLYAQAATYPGQFGTGDTAYISSAYLETGKDYPSHSTAADIIIDNLIIGDGTNTGKITLSSSGSIRLGTTSTFKNYGTIIYSSTGRIKNNATTPAVISDTANGTVEFAGAGLTIDDINATGNDYHNLVVSGTASLGGTEIKASGTFKNTAAITGGTSLEVTGTSTIGADITTTGTQKYTGNVTYTGGRTLTAGIAATPSTITFSGTVTGPATATALTIGSATVKTNVNFAKAVTNVSDLTIYGATTNAGTITTSGVQTYTGAVTNNGTINVPSITGNGVIFNGGFSGGTLTESTSADTNIVFTGGTVTIGTFTNTNNKVIFGDNANITLSANGKTFKNIEVATGTHTLTLTNGDTINVSGNWVHSSGTVTATGTTVKVSGDVSGTNPFDTLEVAGDLAGNHTITKLTIAGASPSSSNITGSNTIGTFICNTGKKTITFTAGTTQTVSNALTLSASERNEINLQSSTAGTKWKINASSAIKNVSNVKVKDSESLTDTIEASASLSLGNNVNWIIAQNFVWTGASSTAWTTAGNWKTTFNGSDAANPATEYPGQISTEDAVTIGADATNEPAFSTTAITIRSLNISDADRTFTFSSASDIKVKAGSITNKGKIVYTSSGRIKNNAATPVAIMDAANGTVEFAGTGLTIDDINATGNDYHNLVVSGTASLGGDIKTAGTLTTTAAITGGASLEVAGTSSIGANITTTGDQTYNNTISLTANTNLTAANVILKNTVTCSTAYSNTLTITANTKIGGTLSIKTNSATFSGTVTNTGTANLTFGENATNRTNTIFNKDISGLTSLTVWGTTTLQGILASISSAQQTYEGAVTYNNDLTLSGTVSSNSSFTSSTNKNLTINTGSFTHKTAAFQVGTLTVAAGATFTQTGDNGTNNQSAASLVNNGTMIWDSASDGGTLSVTGIISHDTTDDLHLIVFNNKNLNFSANTTISGIFYNLEIPASITITNGHKIVVRNNFTINGTYTHNNKDLVLGSITVGTGTSAKTYATGPDGLIDGSVATLNLGKTTINQNAQTKTFNKQTAFTTLLCQDTTTNAGNIIFTQNVTVDEPANLTTKCNYIFGSAGTAVTVNFKKGVSFNPVTGVSINGTLQAGTSGGILINGLLTLTGNTNIKTTSATEAISLQKITGADYSLTIPTAGKIELHDTVTVKELTITNPKSLLAENSISASNGFTLTGIGTVNLGKAGTTAISIETTNKDISFNGSQAAEVTDAKVKLLSNVTLNTNTEAGNVTLNQPVDDTAANTHSFTINAGTGNVLLKSDSGKTTPLGDTSISGTAVTLFTSKTLNANSVVITNSGLLRLNANTLIVATNGFTKNGNGLSQIAGTIRTNNKAITFNKTTYIDNEASFDTSNNGGTVNPTAAITIGSTVTDNLYISAITGTTAQAVTFKADTLDVKGNIALFNGNVTLNANMTSGKDIILLNGNTTTMYNDSGNTTKSGITGLFDYHNPLRTTTNLLCPPSLTAYPATMPDGSTTITHNGTYKSSLAGFSGKTITSKQNFYDNGVNLNPGTQWYLAIKSNGSALNSFAEAYYAEIGSCKVSCSTNVGTNAETDFAWLSAGEGCTDKGNNITNDSNATLTYLTDDGTGRYNRTQTGVAFIHPKVLKNDNSHSATEGRTTGPEIPNLSGTYSVRNNVIRVEFVRSDNNGKNALIENSNNEISHAISAIKVNGGADTFEGAYIDAACTISTDGKGDLAVFYIKASSITWETTATGISGAVKTDLTIERALSGFFYTLTDDHKNRISSYTANPTTTPSDTEGYRFTATTSRLASDDMYITFAVADFTSKEIYLYFDYPVNFDVITWDDTSNPTKGAIKILTSTAGAHASNSVDSVERIPNTQYGIKLNMHDELDYSMIQYGIKIEYDASFQRTNKIHSPSIDGRERVVENGETHCISDVITGLVDVQYAYDNRNDAYNESTGQLITEESIVMRNFTGVGMHNRVFADKDITLVTKDIAPNTSGTSQFSYKLVADITPTAGALGTQFNKYSGHKTKFWFPNYGTYLAPISGFSQGRNDSANIQISDTAASALIEQSYDSATLTTTYLFHNFHENTPCLNWPAESNVSFFFEVTRTDGSPIEINHKYRADSGEITPLYCARLKDPLDPTSIDLWSFIMSEPKRQRGGATIYSNVINAANKDFCTLEVDMPRDGNLRVIIMTADGNIVKYLENGRQTRGLHYYYWNGTNNAGDTVARGIYFIRVVGPDIEETRKVMVVK